MHCLDALGLLSPDLDRELAADERTRLHDHLEACGTCRAAADAARQQHAELRRAFGPRRQAAAATAARVGARISLLSPRKATAMNKTHDPALQRTRWRLAWLMAAAIAGLSFGLYEFSRLQPTSSDGAPASARPSFVGSPPETFLTAKPQAAFASVKPLAVGEAVQTRAGQRRRVGLPDGSVLYVNQNTTVQLEDARRLRLSAGEVFLEVAPRDPKGPAANFVVQTPQRQVTATGTKFAVNASDGSAVLVTQGSVEVSDARYAVTSGQQLAAGQRVATPAVRVSHLLDWTRELMAAAETPLVPDSKYAGGALVAVDPHGQEAKLSLRKYHVDVHIEDGFARTVIDQTYFNQNAGRMEGTFYFPLPPDASLSRLAMYVGEDLMEGGMAEREFARGVYEEIVATQKDPALLEWVDGSTFKMRVFPLEARQEKRIIIGYTQRLSLLYGKAQYRFPAGHSLGVVRDWSFAARLVNGAGLNPSCDSHSLTRRSAGADLVLETKEKAIKFDRDVVLDLGDAAPASAADRFARFSGCDHEGNRYLMLRYRPEFTAQRQRQARDWVFLFEASGDRDPLLARVQIDIIRGLLANAEHDDTFAVLSAGTRVQVFRDKPARVTPANVKAAVEFLESRQLIGALDLVGALDATRPFLDSATNPYLVHVGSGVAALGEKRIDPLAKRLPEKAKYVGVGVGKRWARDFMKATAERSGGHFTQINPDEAVGWRSFELAATLNTPRLMNIRLAGENSKVPFLTFGSALAEGEELCAIARYGPNDVLPKVVAVNGILEGHEFSEEIDVGAVAGGVGHLPRSWAKLEIERLLADADKHHQKAIVELSKAMYVMSPFTSLLVLENEEMYARFKVDRGRKDHWATYPAPAKIKVVYEPEDGQVVDVRFAPKTEKPHPNQVMETILVRNPPAVMEGERANGAYYGTALDVARGSFEMDGMPGPFAKRNGDFQRKFGPMQPKPGKKAFDLAFSEWSRFAISLRSEELAKPRFKDDAKLLSDRARVSLGRNKIGNLKGRMEEIWSKGEPRPLAPMPEPSFVLGYFGGDEKYLRPNTMQSFNQMMADRRRTRGHGSLNSMLTFDGRLLRTRDAVPSSDDMGLYQRPAFSHDTRVTHDLVSYAPGLNSTRADVEAVTEAEALSSLASQSGAIDPEARRLIEQSRSAAWHTARLGEGDRAFTVAFNGRDRYTYERTLEFGLRERVVCDGTTLYHLYPELGLAARRTVSHFHRAEIVDLLPWQLPPADDLAHGADVTLLDPTTVAVAPRIADAARDDDGKAVPYVRMHLVFDESRLTERHLVEMPANKRLLRETYDAEGVVRRFDAQDKETSKRDLRKTPIGAPGLSADTDGLVVLDLPYRSVNHVYATHGLERSWLMDDDTSWVFDFLDADAATELFASEFASMNADVLSQLFRHCFVANGSIKRGHFALMGSVGIQVAGGAEFVKMYEANPREPLLAYLALHQNPKYAALQAWSGLHWGGLVSDASPFLRRVSLLADLELRWHHGQPTRGSRAVVDAELKRLLDYAAAERESELGLAALTLAVGHIDGEAGLAVADAWKRMNLPGLSYIARYEEASFVFGAEKDQMAAALFRDLYRDTVKAGSLPVIDRTFRDSLKVLKGGDAWTSFVREAADEFLRRKNPVAVIGLASQCWALDDEPLAQLLLKLALNAPATEDERLAITLSAVEFLTTSHQFDLADLLIQPILEHAEYRKRPAFWRLGARVAQNRGRTADAIARLERAVDIEYRDLPAVIDLAELRQDYGILLDHYLDLAKAAAVLHAPAPNDLAARTVKAADRWRALDPENGPPCTKAAEVLRTLGAIEMAWDYLTTPIGKRPNEAGPWRGLAQTLSHEGELLLADRAFKAAFEAEPTDAQLLWDRAQNLQRAGKLAEAREQMRLIAGGDWQPRFNGLKSQARWQLEGR